MIRDTVEWIINRQRLQKYYLKRLNRSTRITYENEQSKTQIQSRILLLDELLEYINSLDK